jgi:hypothetical protein
VVDKQENKHLFQFIVSAITRPKMEMRAEHGAKSKEQEKRRLATVGRAAGASERPGRMKVSYLDFGEQPAARKRGAPAKSKHVAEERQRRAAHSKELR